MRLKYLKPRPHDKVVVGPMIFDRSDNEARPPGR